MNYTRLTETVVDKGQLVDGKMIYKILGRKINNKDFYYSIYKYTDTHRAIFKDKGTIAGITDVKTKSLVFDFDDKEHPERAKEDASEMVDRLLKEGIAKENIQIYFSGYKGFAIVTDVEQEMTPPEMKNICMNLAKDLITVDPKVYNASRVFRLPLTKHPTTGLYKIPLTVEQLHEMSIEQIKEEAKSNFSPDDIAGAWGVANLSKNMMELKDKTPEIKVREDLIKTLDLSSLDRSNIPKDYDLARWALLNGYFEDGNRSTALLCLAAYLKSKGYSWEIAYRMLKGTCELQSQRTNDDRFPDTELYNNIVMQVYGDNWKGGTYSLTDPGSWLYQYAKTMGLLEEITLSVRQDILPIQQVSGLFKSFAANIDKNRLAFGIKEIDENLDALVGRTYIIGGSPGSGKTSLALQIMNNTSVKEIRSVFFSFDMSLEDVYQKLIQKHFKISAKHVYEQSKNPERLAEFEKVLEENYSHVHFIRSAGMSVEAMRDRITQIEKTYGEVKMVIVDYLDLVQADFSDPTQKSMAVIQGLKSIGSEMRKCMIVLSQPNKANQKINEAVTTYAAIKGSSAVAELANAVLWVHRPGASARGFEDDKFYGIDCLKNRHGALFAIDLAWEGISGTVSSLDPIGKVKLEQLRQKLKEEKQEEKNGGSF